MLLRRKLEAFCHGSNMESRRGGSASHRIGAMADVHHPHPACLRRAPHCPATEPITCTLLQSARAQLRRCPPVQNSSSHHGYQGQGA